MILTAHFTNTGSKMSCTTKKIVSLLMIGMFLSAPTLQSFDLKQDWHIAAGLIGITMATTLGAQYMWKKFTAPKPCKVATRYQYHIRHGQLLFNYETGKFVHFVALGSAQWTEEKRKNTLMENAFNK